MKISRTAAAVLIASLSALTASCGGSSGVAQTSSPSEPPTVTAPTEEGGDGGAGSAATDHSLAARLARHGFPKLAIQIQEYAPAASLLTAAASWDLLILDAELTANNPAALGAAGRIRSLNPDAVLLDYFSAADVIPGNTATINSGFIDSLEEGWYMKDVDGARYKLFEVSDGVWTDMLNLTTGVAYSLPSYLDQHVQATGYWDGQFYDWTTDDIAWLNAARAGVPCGIIDIDNDGIEESDAELNAAWVAGMKAMLAASRAAFPSGSLIVGNAGWSSADVTFSGNLNGIMIEQFLEGEAYGERFTWDGVMNRYALMLAQGAEPRVSLIMANGASSNTGQMRFALASALMFNGYFAYTNRDGAYASTWWYDEYSADTATGASSSSLAAKGYLGDPSGDAVDAATMSTKLYDVLAAGQIASDRAWRRDFENGVVLVNPSNSTLEVILGGTFRKIRGTADPATNDGSSIMSVSLPSRSGLVLLR